MRHSAEIVCRAEQTIGTATCSSRGTPAVTVCECVSLVIATKTAQPHRAGYCLIDANSSPTCLCKYNQPVCPSAKVVIESLLLQKHPARSGILETCTFIVFTIWQFVKMTYTHTLVERHKCHSTHCSATGCDSVSFIGFHTHFPSDNIIVFSK